MTDNALKVNSNYVAIPRALYHLGLSAGAIATHGFLASLINRNPKDKDRYTCYPSQTTIGEAVGCNRKTAGKYVDELVEAGLVSVEETMVTTADGQRWKGNLKYTLLNPQHAVDLFNERQFAKLEAGVKKKRTAMKKAAEKRERKQKPHDEYVSERSAHEPEELPC